MLQGFFWSHDPLSLPVRERYKFLPLVTYPAKQRIHMTERIWETSFPGLFSAESRARGKRPWHRLVTCSFDTRKSWDDRACAFNLQVPYPQSNSGKRTFAYSAATLFNCLDTDIKQIACASPSCIIYSSRLNNFKHKLFILFLKFASNVSHLEELMCYDCRFSLYCNCIRR